MPITIESGPTSGSTRVVVKPGLLHPAGAVGAGVVEAARRLDEHVQAHHQAERVLRSVVVDDRLVDDERAARRAARRTPWRSASSSSADPSRAGCGPSARRRPSADPASKKLPGDEGAADRRRPAPRRTPRRSARPPAGRSPMPRRCGLASAICAARSPCAVPTSTNVLVVLPRKRCARSSCWRRG